MSITLLKDVLIDTNMIENYYEGTVPTNLWRALKKKSGLQVFEFVEDAYLLSNGRPRAADIEIKNKNGEKWVFIKQRPRGVSTFDKPGVPKGKNWDYIKISKGTDLPNDLAIVKDHYNSEFEATHYTIAPAYDMPLSQFKSKLAAFAENLIKKAI